MLIHDSLQTLETLLNFDYVLKCLFVLNMYFYDTRGKVIFELTF